jgi:hypothetical protein
LYIALDLIASLWPWWSLELKHYSTGTCRYRREGEGRGVDAEIFFSGNYINPDSIPIGTKMFGTFVPARQFRLKNRD